MLAKLNSDVKARDQKLAAREQDQADLAQVLKTIEQTLARQAREAEEARQRALLAAQEAEKQRQREALAANQDATPKKPRAVPGPLVSSDGATFGGAFLQHGANFHGRSMVDCWHVLVKPAATTREPSGTG